MNALEEFRNRYRQYVVHKGLLGAEEVDFYTRKLDEEELHDEERAFLEASRAARKQPEPETSRDQIDDDSDHAVEVLHIQEQLSLLGERLKGQHNLLSRQNWMGSLVVVGTGLLFWSTGDDIIAGAFVTLSSMFLQTMAGNFAGFFGGGQFGQQQQQFTRPPSTAAPAAKPITRKG